MIIETAHKIINKQGKSIILGCAQIIPLENFSCLFQPLRHHSMVWYYIVCLKMRDITGPKVINDHHLNTKLVY